MPTLRRDASSSLEVAAGVMNAVQAGHQFGEQGFIGAAVAEIWLMASIRAWRSALSMSRNALSHCWRWAAGGIGLAA
jgi:hypothetical protein